MSEHSRPPGGEVTVSATLLGKWGKGARAIGTALGVLAGLWALILSGALILCAQAAKFQVVQEETGDRVWTWMTTLVQERSADLTWMTSMIGKPLVAGIAGVIVSVFCLIGVAKSPRAPFAGAVVMGVVGGAGFIIFAAKFWVVAFVPLIVGSILLVLGSSPAAEIPKGTTVLGKVAAAIENYMEPLYRWLAHGGVLVLVFLVVAMIYSAIGRYLNHPLNGATDIQAMGLLALIALAMGFEHMGHEKMTVDAICRLFPKKMQAILQPIIFIVVLVMLGFAIYYLFKLGIKKQDTGETTKGLRLIKYPFVYLISFGMITLFPIYLARLLHSIDGLVKR